MKFINAIAIFYWKKTTHKLHLSHLFCCNHTCYCVNIVSVTSASCYHPRHQSRSSMLRGLIPWNFKVIGRGSYDCGRYMYQNFKSLNQITQPGKARLKQIVPNQTAPRGSVWSWTIYTKMDQSRCSLGIINFSENKYIHLSYKDPFKYFLA